MESHVTGPTACRGPGGSHPLQSVSSGPVSELPDGVTAEVHHPDHVPPHHGLVRVAHLALPAELLVLPHLAQGAVLLQADDGPTAPAVVGAEDRALS